MKNTEVFPQWWHFDGDHGILYCEVEKKDRKTVIKETARLIPSVQYEGAWMATTSNKKYILWKDQEIVSANEIVGEVYNWSINGKNNEENDHTWTFNLYLCFKNQLYWTKDETQPYSVELNGNHKSSTGHFTDRIRVLIPLEHDRAIAISERERWYYLIGKPIDWRLFLKEDAAIKKAEERAARRKERIAEKAAKKEYRHSVFFALIGLCNATIAAAHKDCRKA